MRVSRHVRPLLAVASLFVLSCSSDATGPQSVATITVTPGTVALESDASVALVAVVRSASGAALVGRVITWTSSAPGFATVTTTGLVTAGRVLGGVEIGRAHV